MATNAKKLTYWQQHFKRCQASGLTRHAYCTREGLALSTFDRWRSFSRSTGGTSSKAALTLVPVAVERPLHATLKSPAGWEITLPVVSAFVSIDIYALNVHYKKLGTILSELDAGRVPDNDTMAQGIVRALNLPYLSFLRVTFLHAPLAAIFTMIAMFVGNVFFNTGYESWQIYTFGATIAFFSSPAHAIIEYFVTAKRRMSKLSTPIQI